MGLSRMDSRGTQLQSGARDVTYSRLSWFTVRIWGKETKHGRVSLPLRKWAKMHCQLLRWPVGGCFPLTCLALRCCTCTSDAASTQSTVCGYHQAFVSCRQHRPTCSIHLGLCLSDLPTTQHPHTPPLALLLLAVMQAEGTHFDGFSITQDEHERLAFAVQSRPPADEEVPVPSAAQAAETMTAAAAAAEAANTAGDNPYVGAIASRRFEGHGVHEGRVTSSEMDEDTNKRLYHVVYPDGDEEDLDDEELAVALIPSQNVRRLAIETSVRPRSGGYSLRQRAQPSNYSDVDSGKSKRRRKT